jgi:hypothetical protein
LVATAKTISLDSLSENVPVVPEEAVGFYKQNCMVCFDSQSHASGIGMAVEHPTSVTSFRIVWEGAVTDQMRRAYADMTKATEYAACAVSLLIIPEITEYTAFEQAIRGTTIDYYLCSKKREDKLIFNRSARMEATGILCENSTNSIEKRLAEKRNRLSLGLPTYIVAVEFSTPKSKVVKI